MASTMRKCCYFHCFNDCLATCPAADYALRCAMQDSIFPISMMLLPRNSIQASGTPSS